MIISALIQRLRDQVNVENENNAFKDPKQDLNRRATSLEIDLVVDEEFGDTKSTISIYTYIIKQATCAWVIFKVLF